MPMKYTTNPTVTLNPFSPTTMQIRFADGNHVSVAHDPGDISLVLEHGGEYSLSEWRDILTTKGMEFEKAEELLGLLRHLGALIVSDSTTESLTDALFENEDGLVRPFKFHLREPAVTSVAIEGDGELHTVACDAVSRMENLTSTSESCDLVIVCSDSENLPLISELWKSSPESSFKFALWSDGGGIRLGPMWVKHESACFACYVRRLMASSDHVEESIAFANSRHDRVRSLPLGRPALDLARYAVYRALRMHQRSLFHILEPGYVERWDILRGIAERFYVLRNPYCPACSSGPASRRAVRDMM